MNQKRNVLFVGMTDYDLSQENGTIRKKMEGMAHMMNVFILARGQRCRSYYKHRASFTLIPRSLGKLGMIIWFFRALIDGAKIIRKEKIDTIVAQSPAIDGLAATILSRMYKKELIVEVHGDWINAPFFYFNLPFESFIKSILRLLGKYSLGRADKIRSISSFTTKIAIQYNDKAELYTFPTFTDIDIFLQEDDIRWDKRIVYIGVLYRLKGVHYLIEAFQKVSEDIEGFTLEVVGDGPFRGELEAMVGKSDNVIFHGWKQQNEVRDLLKFSYALVLPSQSEGLGRVLIEAAALHKPLIGTNVDGIPDIIKDGENGYLFESGNVNDLASCLQALMADTQKAQAMGQCGYEMVRGKYSLEQYFSSYQSLIYS